MLKIRKGGDIKMRLSKSERPVDSIKRKARQTEGGKAGRLRSSKDINKHAKY